jgi:hypothetical protein
VPFLLRLRRRFGTWWASAIGLVAFAVMFSVSAFVIGPAISGGADGPRSSGRDCRSGGLGDGVDQVLTVVDQ